jgi:hypothetical protein
MTLPNFIDSEHFNRLRRLMNAPLPDNFSSGYAVNRLTHDDLDKALEGIEGLTVDDIDQVQPLPDGTLAYRERRIILYIRDTRVFAGRNSQQQLPKFHIADCSKLAQMRQNGRFERYVISTRTDGKFKMNFMDGVGSQSSICELKVCKLCLERLHYNGYRQGTRQRDKEIYNSFALQEYFTAHPKNQITVMPLHTDHTAPLDEYGNGFREASQRYRAENGWKCENCRIDLSHPCHRKYLHTHHLNAQKFDDRRENHRALCIRCHSEEPMHAHLKNSRDYREFLGVYARLLQAARRA